MEKLCTNKNDSYKYNEQINKQDIYNYEYLGVIIFNIYTPYIINQNHTFSKKYYEVISG
jgi:hypothetical protein